MRRRHLFGYLAGRVRPVGRPYFLDVWLCRLASADYFHLARRHGYLRQRRIVKMRRSNFHLQSIQHRAGKPDVNACLSVADLSLIQLAPQNQHLFANVSGVR